MMSSQSSLQNEKMQQHVFLKDMYADSYFPNDLVDKGKALLVGLCESIEKDKPANLDALYALTHATTEAFNSLAEEFEENGSEIETAARDAIGTDFGAIAEAYGFAEADLEELIAPRDW